MNYDKHLLTGKRAVFAMYYEGSSQTIYVEHEGTVTLVNDEIVFVADDGCKFYERNFDNYDLIKIMPMDGSAVWKPL